MPTIHFNGKDGTNGTSKGATGRNGEDVFVKVPVGSIITDVSDYSMNDYDSIDDDEDDEEEYDENTQTDEELEDDEDELEAIEEEMRLRAKRRGGMRSDR